MSGGVLLSHHPPVAVPSALAGLTSRFGMETGCFPDAMATETLSKYQPKPTARATHHNQTRCCPGCGGLGVLAVFREPYSEREHRYIAQYVVLSQHARVGVLG